MCKYIYIYHPRLHPQVTMVDTAPAPFSSKKQKAAAAKQKPKSAGGRGAAKAAGAAVSWDDVFGA